MCASVMLRVVSPNPQTQAPPDLPQTLTTRSRPDESYSPYCPQFPESLLRTPDAPGSARGRARLAGTQGTQRHVHSFSRSTCPCSACMSSNSRRQRQPSPSSPRSWGARGRYLTHTHEDKLPDFMATKRGHMVYDLLTYVNTRATNTPPITLKH